MLQGRAHLARSLLRWGKALGARPEVAHDSVLVMDRVMSTGLEVGALFAAKGLLPFGHVEAAGGGASSLAPGLQPLWSVGPLLLPQVFTFGCSLACQPKCRACIHT